MIRLAHSRRRARLLVAGCAAAAAAVALGGGAAFAALPPANTTALVSLETTNTSGVNNRADITDVSENGRYVVYQTTANDAGAMNPSGNIQVYLRDVVTDTVTLISVRMDGDAGSDGNSTDGAVSADGRFVAFVSDASNLVPGGVAGITQVFVRDVMSGTTTLLSRLAMTVGDQPSYEPTISDDGKRIAFTSTAANLTGDAVHSQVLITDRTTPGVLNLVSGIDGTMNLGDDHSRQPSISGNGNIVTFASLATDLDPARMSLNLQQIYVRNIGTMDTEMISLALGSATNGSNRDSSDPSVSMDGSFVAFTSLSDDLTANQDDPSVGAQVYVRDVAAETNELISVSLTGTWSNNDAALPSISSNGDRVAFATGATNIQAGTSGNNLQAWVRSRSEAYTALVSATTADSLVGGGPAGRFAVAPMISGDGRYVGFSSDELDLTPTNTNDYVQAYLRALPTSLIPPVPNPQPSNGNNNGGLAATGVDGVLVGGLAVGAIGMIVAAGAVLLLRRRSA